MTATSSGVIGLQSCGSSSVCTVLRDSWGTGRTQTIGQVKKVSTGKEGVVTLWGNDRDLTIDITFYKKELWDKRRKEWHSDGLSNCGVILLQEHVKCKDMTCMKLRISLKRPWVIYLAMMEDISNLGGGERQMTRKMKEVGEAYKK